MESERELMRLVNRQGNDQQCLDAQKLQFEADPVLLKDCVPAEDACLCAQEGSNSFSEWYLDAVCGTCAANGNGGAIDPLVALEEICPEQAAVLADSYTCSNFTPSSIQSRSSIQATISPAIITRTASIPSISSFHFSPTSTSSLTTITPSMVLISKASSSHPGLDLSSRTTKSLPPTGTTTVPASVTAIDASPVVSTSRQNNGLSIGAKAGIGVATGISLILLTLAILFLFCRRRRKKAGWSSTGVNTRELYPEDGVNSAYALNDGYSESPIGTAMTTETKAQLGNDGFVPTVREIYLDDDQDESPTEQTRVTQMNSRPNTQISMHDLPTPLPKTYPITAITRKEVAAPSPPATYPTTTSLPRTIYTPSPTQSRSGSRMSGVLRGPVPDMYAFGGETIENDEELERLEEEERRIDEAIKESERLRNVQGDGIGSGRIDDHRMRRD